MKTTDLKKILGKTVGITDYRINSVNTESYELFFVHEALETVRSTDTADTKVTVFVEHEDKLGEATFSVYASFDEKKVVEEIEKAKKKAALIDNEIFPLPADEKAEYAGESNMAKYDFPTLGKEIAEAVYAADGYEGGSINALEIFLYRDTVQVVNSRGVDKKEVRYRAMIEAIPTWTDGESVELYEQYNFTEFNAEEITKEIDQKMREVRDRMSAKKPQEKLKCKVVLTAPELSELIHRLTSELNYSKLYGHTNAYSVGDRIQKNNVGDAMTVTVCGNVKGSVASAHFDREGYTLGERKIIEEGKAIDNYGSVRYAHYLNARPTGDVRCIKVEEGTANGEELKQEPYFKCVSMSGLQLDIYSDYIGGEVRLAYYFDGEKEIPVTGISISGKLSDALSSMKLSDTKVTYEGYQGPDFCVFDNVDIV